MDEPDGTDDSQPAPSAPGPSHHSAGFPLPRTNTGDFSDVDSDTDEHPAVSRTGNRAEPSFLAPPSATPSRRPSAVSLHPPLAHLEAFRAPPSENPFRRFHFDFGRRKEDDEGSVRSWDGSSVTANEHPNGTSNGQNNHFDELRSAAGSPVPDSGTAKRWKRLDGKKLWSWTKTAVPWLEWFPEYIGATPPATLDPTSIFNKDHDAFAKTPWYKRGAWRECIKGDLLAGITIGVMVVPQGMAYATLASLPPIYGLYSCLVPIALYIFLGTSREMSLGPVAVNALLLTSSLYPSVASLPAETRLPTYLSLVFTTTLLTGIFSLAMGLFRLGLAVTFVGPPVMEGFTMGSIILIGLSQLEPLLGYSTGPPQPYIVPQLINTFSNIRKTQPAALVLGLVSIAILLTLGKFRYTAWIPRPLFVTVVMTLISWGIHVNTTWGLPIVGDVPRGLPSLIIPTLDASTIAQCAVPAILLAILGFMQSFAVALRFAEKRGYTVQPNQELAALGITHILSSFTQSMDSTGSYSRTSVKANAGARTQISGLFELILLILTLQFLTSLFYYIPKSALAAIVMAAVINMFEPAGFRRMLRTKPRDFWVAVLTALITVFTSSQYGLLAGVAMSLFLIVWRSSHPPHAVLGLVSFPAPEGTVPVQSYRNVERYPEARQEPGIMVWRFDAELWFANVNYFREKLQGELAKRRVQRTPKWAGREEVVFDNTGIGLGIREAEEEEDDDRVRVLVLDMTSIVDVDSSGAQALLALNSTLRKSQGIEVLFAGVKGPVRDVLWRATEGRILPDDMIAGKGKKEKAAKPAAEVATGNGEVTDPTASQIQVIPDEPPNDRPNEPGIPMIAFEDRNGKVTLVPHPAPETLARAAPSPSVPRRGWKVPPNATIVGSTWGRNVTATDLYVEQFFLSVAGAVEFAKRLVARQKAKEAKTRMGVV